MEYHPAEIEQKAKEVWQVNQVFKVPNTSDKPKYYVLDMFPYPSGAGLHVGHPLGYIASDIFSRYKKMKGFNVLHPMGFDAFGLPAEQYALETGQHPIDTTEKNIAQYKKQLNNIGFNYDWSREVRTSNPDYYKWTQWIFLKLFKSWFNRKTQKAESLDSLIAIFEKEGNLNYTAPHKEALIFSAAEWLEKSMEKKRSILMQYRLAYLDFAEVWWCEALGTVLANDEIVNGVSERGGHPVEKKKMRQWFLRITEFADRLLDSLNHLEWSDAMKEMQKNWIGKSEGAEVSFKIQNCDDEITVFTTRPDTIFGVDFMVLAPEHTLVQQITSSAQQKEIEEYVAFSKSRSERERISEKKISGCFTGAYAIHPFSGNRIPIWISEYVLAGYGTGAIMAVPSGDDRDHAFAQHFGIEITNIFGAKYDGTAAVSEKSLVIENSDFLSGLKVADAAQKVFQILEEKKIGKKKTNYKLRDAGFSRQRYWGEPFPILYKNDIPFAIDEDELNIDEKWHTLPLELPHVDTYTPGPEGEGPLANIEDWVYVKNKDGELLKRETNTMPGYAGSSWYFLRFMDPHNSIEFADKKNTDYWNQVDLYIGGTEHAVGHLLYSRMWTKTLHDLGFLSFDEPFKHLVNQGMITGKSFFLSGQRYCSTEAGSTDQIDRYSSRVDNLDTLAEEVVEDNQIYKKSIGSKLFSINEQAFYKRLRNAHNYIDSFGRLTKSMFIEYLTKEQLENEIRIDQIDWDKLPKDTNNEPYLEGMIIEKMSKSKYNVVNPDEIVKQYGADTFRMYEMFLGPIEMSKPWDTKGIEGVHRFLRKFWRLFYNDQEWMVTQDEPTAAEWKSLHKSIKKIEEDTQKFSFNTAVSQFMICINELHELKCHKEEVLQVLVRLIAPYAPHCAEVLWGKLGNQNSVIEAEFPEFKEEFVKENSKMYPVAINGKSRVNLEFPLDADQKTIEEKVLSHETIQKWLEGKPVKKVIYVKGRMINVVI